MKKHYRLIIQRFKLNCKLLVMMKKASAKFITVGSAIKYNERFNLKLGFGWIIKQIQWLYLMIWLFNLFIFSLFLRYCNSELRCSKAALCFCLWSAFKSECYDALHKLCHRGRLGRFSPRFPAAISIKLTKHSFSQYIANY